MHKIYKSFIKDEEATLLWVQVIMDIYVANNYIIYWDHFDTLFFLGIGLPIVLYIASLHQLCFEKPPIPVRDLNTENELN